MTETATQAHYTDTAYRSNRKAPEPAEDNRQGAVFRKSWTMGSPLTKGRLYGLVPPSLLALWSPSWLRDDKRLKEENGVDELVERHTYFGRLDEECIRYATLPKSSWALLWMQHGGRICFIWLFPIALLVLAYGWWIEHETTTFSVYFHEGILPLFLYMFLPMLLCWGVGRFLEKKFPHIVYRSPKGPLWELNRRTGLVTLFDDITKDETAGQVKAQAPFHDWEGYLMSLPDHQGNIWHRLMLVHKTREWALPLNQLLAATTNKQDVLAYWDLIRQYMDVTKPLPDVPVFEAYRSLDPTTRAYDTKKGRDPRYWFDMDDETFEAVRRENEAKVRSSNWGE
ncbi:hypothetical protein [Marinobacter fonticola]|uniref:hypothetical protein n=1 Tax=Marinobacter fonticola TaxID=2603215 RepID=UPI0011E7EB43|nr:hypothetical protein [Marinobacter fonticola]